MSAPLTPAAPSDDPYGGVLAANQAVQALLEQLTDFCAGAAIGEPAGDVASEAASGRP